MTSGNLHAWDGRCINSRDRLAAVWESDGSSPLFNIHTVSIFTTNVHKAFCLVQSYIEATLPAVMHSSLGTRIHLRPTYTHATLRLALGRCAAPCLMPLHIRHLGFDGSPDPPIRTRSGHPPNSPIHKDGHDFYKYYLDYK